MRQIVDANKRTELLQIAEIQRFSLEASVNSEIAIVLEMANSSIIIEHFLNPEDQALRRIAFEEINRYTQALKSKSSFWVSDKDLVFYLGEDTHYILDPEDPDSYWYKMTMYETEIFNFNINYNPDLQVTNFWINAPVFDSDRNPIGILGTGINLTEFVDTIFRNHKGDADLYFFNNIGEITGATDMTLVANKVFLDRELPDTGPFILSWVRNEAPDTMRTFSGPEGEIAVCPIPAVGWYIIAAQALSLKDYLSTSMTYLFLGIMGIIIIFFIILQIGKYAFDILNRTRQELRVERDIIATMKDNLSVGMFLMDKDYVIQASYSKPLENILGNAAIEGNKLTDYLSASFKVKDLESLKKYFNMVLNRKLDQKMLEEVNPISEFTYVDGINNRKKILKTVFSSVDMGEENFFVLGTLEDISATKELEQQLLDASNKREEEMRVLFQVIQVDSTVFSDFLEDTDYEFGIINDILKDKKQSAYSAMLKIYQSVHAIKSNSVILGLDNFAAKLHELEDNIRHMQDRENITFDDILHITEELQKIMKEKEKYQNITAKIDSYRISIGGSRRQDRHVLIKTLTEVCSKAAFTQKKKVEFIIDELDGSILEHGPRRVIKEVLTQLVRNSVYHGIETPEKRTAMGKKAGGTVKLSMTQDNNQIHIKLSDDGKGLDFEEIRKKAISQKLLSEEDAGNKNKLLQIIFSPGFSTAGSADVHAGRGIGLNLVGDRLRQLGGTLKLANDPGKGLSFHLFIPIKASA